MQRFELDERKFQKIDCVAQEKSIVALFTLEEAILSPAVT